MQYRADYAKAEPLFRSALFIDEARLEANPRMSGLEILPASLSMAQSAARPSHSLRPTRHGQLIVVTVAGNQLVWSSLRSATAGHLRPDGFEHSGCKSSNFMVYPGRSKSDSSNRRGATPYQSHCCVNRLCTIPGPSASLSRLACCSHSALDSLGLDSEISITAGR